MSFQRLTYQIGSTAGFDVELYDQDDSSVDLSGASAGVFVLRSEEAGENLIHKTSGISFASNVATVSLDASDTSDLAPGVYIGELRFTKDSKNFATEIFHVELIRSLTL